jgi:hypothetical protein
MIKPQYCRAAIAALAECVLASCLAGRCFAQISYPEQEIRIDDLPSLTAKSREASDVLATSLEIIFRRKKICCAKDSALEDSVQAADPRSLKDVANKLQGSHLLSDGRPITVTAEYLAPASVNAGQLFTALTEKHAPLMMWNSRLYVVYGVTFEQTAYQDSGLINAIHKFLLLDARFSDQRREVSFDRLTDDWGKVQGLLLLKVDRQ